MLDPGSRKPSPPPQPRGLNQHQYRGDRIDIDRVLHAIRSVAAADGWSLETFGGTVDARLFALHRAPVGTATRRAYLSTGIHGDEPAGPLSVLDLLRRDHWPHDVEVWICPCLNPSGAFAGTRENASGQDLNRDYRDPQTPEVRCHVQWLASLPPFDVALCLHEDWEAKGFYLYELNPDGRPSAAETALQEVSAFCPIDPSPVIEGREAQGGIIRPNLDPAQRPQWPEAFYLVQHKTRHSYTLEAPSDYALPVRVGALTTAVESILGMR